MVFFKEGRDQSSFKIVNNRRNVKANGWENPFQKMKLVKYPKSRGLYVIGDFQQLIEGLGVGETNLLDLEVLTKRLTSVER